MIDSYVHCGLSKYQPVEAVLAAMEASNVTRAVLVQHLGEYDHGYLNEVSILHRGTFVTVALVDPDGDNWEIPLSVLAGSPALRGLRLTSDILSAAPTLGLSAAAMGLIPVLYTPDGVRPVIEAINDLAAASPHLPIVITHLGCPRVEDGRMVAGWDLLELSQIPNVRVTLSGMSMFCPFPYLPLAQFVVEVIGAFTAERILWGSNFPVGGDATAYGRDLALVRSGHWGLDTDQIERITEANAAEVFFHGRSKGESGS